MFYKICFARHGGKVGSSSGTPNLWDPQDHPRPLEPLGLSGTPWDSLDSLGPSRSLLISGTPWNPWVPENLPGTTGIPRDMALEKDFSGITISFLYLKNYKFFNYSIFRTFSKSKVIFLRKSLMATNMWIQNSIKHLRWSFSASSYRLQRQIQNIVKHLWWSFCVSIGYD